MAWSIIENELDTTIYTKVYKDLAALAGTNRYIHRAHIKHENFASAMKIGVDNWFHQIAVAQGTFNLPQIEKVQIQNTQALWLAATNTVFASIIGGSHTTGLGQTYQKVAGLKETYYDSTSSDGIQTQLVFGTKLKKAPIGIIDKTIDYLKDEIWKVWDVRGFAMRLDATKGGSDIIWGEGREAPQTAHRKGTTVGEIGVEELIIRYLLKADTTRIDIDWELKVFNIKTIDLIENAMNSVKIYLGTKPKKAKWRVGEKRNVEVDIAVPNPLIPLHDWTAKFRSIIDYYFWLEIQKLRWLSKNTAADAEASQPFNQYVNRYFSAQVRKETIEAYKGKAKVTGNKEIKIPDRKSWNKTYRPPSTPYTAITTLAISKKGKFQPMAIEKGEGQEASTHTARDLARIKKEINKGLTAAVERRMGHDGALTKREGRFSESVELKSLHQAQKTIVAKYTYLLSPYSTFENTGRRRWKLSYNPKTLIAKSIRDLAQGRIEQKLTVRRI